MVKCFMVQVKRKLSCNKTFTQSITNLIYMTTLTHNLSSALSIKDQLA